MFKRNRRIRSAVVVQHSPRFESLEARVLLHGGVVDDHAAPQPVASDSWHGMGAAIPTIEQGESQVVIGPHHSESGHNQTAGKTHYFAETGDAHHFVWQDRDLTTPDVIDILYDFRALNGYTNQITAAQKSLAVEAMNDWTAATGGKLKFTQSTTAALADIINIGTGDLRALGSNYTSKAGGILGLGGATYTHNELHTITRGVSWMDKAENWDTTIGNGNPSGTYDYYTVMAQEIGHALGLGHTDNLSGRDIMDGTYGGETTVFSSNDNAHVQSIYGGTVTPPPPPPATPGITVSPTTGLTTTESGGSASFSVLLNSQPTADVTISLSSSNTNEGTVNKNSLTFTSSNWNTAQTVVVTGKDDTAKDGNKAYTIITGAATSADLTYSGMNASDVSATNKDNEKGSKGSGGGGGKGGGSSGSSVPAGHGQSYGVDKVVKKGKKGDVFAGGTALTRKQLRKQLASLGLNIPGV